MAWHATGNIDDECGNSLGEQFDSLYVDLVSTETAPLYDGIHDLLKDLRGRVKLGALSNACGPYVKAVLNQNKIDCHFDVSFGADEVPLPKPSGQGLLMMANHLNVHPSTCVYVGDAPTDAKASIAAGFKCSVGVEWGSHKPEVVRNAFTYSAGTIKELATILTSLINE